MFDEATAETRAEPEPPSGGDPETMGASLLWTLTFCFGIGGVASCSDEPIVSVSEPSKVLISCPSISTNSSEISYLLRFNGSSVFQIHLNKHDSAETLFSTQIEITADTSGEFVCRRDEIYPPPFRQDWSRTAVRVSEQSVPTVDFTAPSANQSCPDRPPLIPEVVMWTGGGLLLVYSFTITCITVVIWRQNQKLKRDEDTKIYSNVRPKGIKKPNKV